MPQAAERKDSFRLSETVNARRRQVFVDPDTPATVLLTAYLDVYGADPEEGIGDAEESPLDWSPHVKRSQIEDDFNLRFPPGNLAKLEAAVNILQMDRFFKSEKAFLSLANALSGQVDFETLDIADVDECAWAVAEGMLLSQEDEDNPFSESVQAYISARLAEEGYIQVPKVLGPFVPYDAAGRGFDDSNPEIATAVWNRQAELVADTDRMVAFRMLDLAQRLQFLPLLHGDSKRVSEAVMQAYKAVSS